MTAETIKTKMAELEGLLTQQEGIRSSASKAAERAGMAIQQLQGALAVLQQLLDAEAPAAPAAPVTEAPGAERPPRLHEVA